MLFLLNFEISYSINLVDTLENSMILFLNKLLIFYSLEEILEKVEFYLLCIFLENPENL